MHHSHATRQSAATRSKRPMLLREERFSKTLVIVTPRSHGFYMTQLNKIFNAPVRVSLLNNQIISHRHGKRSLMQQVYGAITYFFTMTRNAQALSRRYGWR
jgi:hypothetical protein